MVSPTNPILISRDGNPDGTGEIPAKIHVEPPVIGNQGSVSLQLLNGNQCNGQSEFPVVAEKDGSGHFEKFGRGTPNELSVDQWNTSDPAHRRPIRAQFTERGGKSSGTAQLLDLNNDGRYEKLQLTGSKNGTPVNVTIDIGGVDQNKDGQADFATVKPQVPGLKACTANAARGRVAGLEFDQIFIPCAHDAPGECSFIDDEDGDGSSDGLLDWGPRLDAGASVIEIPTVSGLGVVLLAALLLAVALWRLRRPGLTAGA